MVIEDERLEQAPRFAPCEFRIKLADSAWENRQARALRRAVFCIEQGLFVGDDSDAIDGHAQTLVALSTLAGMPDQVVGTVRLHVQEDGLWWGSRLAVHAAFRHHGRIGSSLIRLAVGTARARACRIFQAQVQAQNVPLFERLRWTVLRTEALHGRPHALMQAALDAYPPCHDPHRGITTRSAL